MKLSEKELKDQLTEIVNDILAEAHLKKGDLFVLGCSTSEVVGGHIGKNSSAEVGQWIIRTLKELLDPKEIALAVQGCEHLNRALVVERTVAEAKISKLSLLFLHYMLEVLVLLLLLTSSMILSKWNT